MSVNAKLVNGITATNFGGAVETAFQNEAHAKENQAFWLSPKRPVARAPENCPSQIY
jgi:hypothetical protein